MRSRLVALLVVFGLATLLGACSTATTPTAMPQMGLRRKGLSSSEVNLPWSQPDSQAKLEVLSCRTFRHMGETVHVLGEIENTSDTRMGGITVKVVGYTAQGTAIDTKEDQAYIDPVDPGEKTPFRVFFDARDVERAELTVTGEPTDAEPPKRLDVANVTLSEPSSGYSHVKGEIANPGTDAVQVTLIAILRDENAAAVEVHRAKLVKPVPAGGTSFDVLALHHGAKTVDVLAFVQSR